MEDVKPMVPTRDAVLVVGCGNADAGDDAFGPSVLRRVREMGLEGVETIDLGPRPAALLDHLPAPAGLILVDAIVDPAMPAGDLIDLPWGEAEDFALVHDDALSTHGLGLSNQLRLARTLGLLPSWVHLVGLVVPMPAWGAEPRELRPERVEAAARRVARAVGRRRS
jgi:hydrogenase maturation protease